MIIYMIFQYVLITGAVIIIGYQLLLCILALLPQHGQKTEEAAFNHSFLLVIHLQNKEQEILKTLYSLYGMVYPANLFEVIVITDNCTASIAKLARKFGAIVLERSTREDKQRSNTLHWALEQVWLWEEKYDAVVVIEPGVLVSGNYLEVMNRYIEDGSEVLQSSNLNVKAQGPWRIRFMHTTRLINKHINMLGRKKLGLGTRLMGNGMCFKTQVLKNILENVSWTAGDLNGSVPLLMEGVRIDFVPEAVVWSYLYDSSVESNSDRGSPKSSQFQILKKHLKHSINHIIVNKSLQYVDTAISLITPSFSTLLIASGGMVVINWVLWILGTISASFFWIWLSLFGMVIFCLLIGIVIDRAIFFDLSSDSKKNDNSDFINTFSVE